MKICNKCAATNDDDSEICSACGYNLSNNLSNISNDEKFQETTNGLAIASMVLGIVSIPLSCCCIGLITGIVGIVLGFIAINQIKNSNFSQKGKPFALSGIILGFISIALVIMVIIAQIFISANPSFKSNFKNYFPNNSTYEFGDVQ